MELGWEAKNQRVMGTTTGTAKDHVVCDDKIQGEGGESICKYIVSEKFSVSLNK